MAKAFWDSKTSRWIWTVCPKCRKCAIIAKKKGDKPDRKEMKHIKEMSNAVFIAKKFDKLEPGCNLGKWSMHVLFKGRHG